MYPGPLIAILGLLMRSCLLRICILSLLRILSIVSWDLDDSTYTGTSTTIYTILEPTIGVVNACLPTTLPALRKLFKNSRFSWAQKSFSKPQDNQHSRNENDIYPHRFERLADDVTPTNAQAPSSQQGIQGEGNRITVIHEWEVRLSPLRYSHQDEQSRA